jgi:hypothetical protein
MINFLLCLKVFIPLSIMSIKSDVLELQSIRQEIKALSAKATILRKKAKEIEERIQEYLRAKDQIGLKHQGTAIILEEKEERAKKKNKDKDQDATYILERYGIQNPEKVLQEILEARKGEKVPKTKLQIKKYKNEKS